jgi:hypothetical protein
MSLHDPISPAPASRTGGETVADLHAMEGPQALAVMMLRDWFDGAEGRSRVADTLRDELGPVAGAAATEAWCDLGALIEHGTRRPVMRHAVTCRCVGADEAVLALVMMQAARGEREDAMLVLSLLVAGERLMTAVRAAERAGRACLQVSARWRAAAAPGPDRRPRVH